MFRDNLLNFESFLHENDLGNIRPVQYEMTYINHIEQKDNWATLGGMGNIFPDFSWRIDQGRFLPEPEAVNWKTIFLLPNRAGRLYVTINNGIRVHDKQPVMNLEVTARGMPDNLSKEAMWGWFDIAHEWIVRGFTDLTSDYVHKNIWKRLR